MVELGFFIIFFIIFFATLFYICFIFLILFIFNFLFLPLNYVLSSLFFRFYLKNDYSIGRFWRWQKKPFDLVKILSFKESLEYLNKRIDTLFKKVIKPFKTF